jgi:chorismate mutase
MSWEYIDTIYFQEIPVFGGKTTSVRVYMIINKQQFLSGHNNCE